MSDAGCHPIRTIPNYLLKRPAEVSKRELVAADLLRHCESIDFRPSFWDLQLEAERRELRPTFVPVHQKPRRRGR